MGASPRYTIEYQPHFKFVGGIVDSMSGCGMPLCAQEPRIRLHRIRRYRLSWCWARAPLSAYRLDVLGGRIIGENNCGRSRRLAQTGRSEGGAQKASGHCRGRGKIRTDKWRKTTLVIIWVWWICATFSHEKHPPRFFSPSQFSLSQKLGSDVSHLEEALLRQCFLTVSY